MGSVIIRERVLWDPRRCERIFLEWMAEMSPEEDRVLLTWLANHAREPGKKEALRILGVTEAPPCTDRELAEQYWVLKEQIEREDDPEVIRTAALNAPAHLAHFARNRITGGRDPSPGRTGSIPCCRSTRTCATAMRSSSSAAASPRSSSCRAFRRSGSGRGQRCAVRSATICLESSCSWTC